MILHNTDYGYTVLIFVNYKNVAENTDRTLPGRIVIEQLSTNIKWSDD